MRFRIDHVMIFMTDLPTCLYSYSCGCLLYTRTSNKTGHWLGLMHTFQTATALPSEYDCNEAEIGLGDFVEDTPLQRGESSHLYCRAYLTGNPNDLPDTCPNLPGKGTFGCESSPTILMWAFSKAFKPCADQVFSLLFGIHNSRPLELYELFGRRILQ